MSFTLQGRKVGTITYGATASDDITTQFNYNPIGELIEVVDPIGLSTFYEYDLAGRVTREEHPDRGVTRTVYDPASNVIQLETPGTLTFGGSVTMEYDYNRLVHKYMPLSSGADLYDMAYTYGTKGDGRNGAGRITQVIQGQGFKTDLLRYDELGNVVDENTTIDVPLYGYKGFTTTKRYDSFGRILQATYPDGDQVTYGYTALGELHTIDSKVGGTTQSIVSGILYNGYGQISKLSYGNGTYTDYDYNVSGSGASTLKKNTLFKTTTTAKEQGATSQSTVLERNYTYNTQGMVTQLDRNVAGTLMNSSAGTTASLSDKYSYDAYGRFDTHQHAIGGSTEYTLDMTYNKAGGIVKKDALTTGIKNFKDLNYTLNYNYNASNPHQLEEVVDSKSGVQSHYLYNSSGSIKEIQDHAAGGPQSFFWNEEQWLSGVRNDLGVHHYVYDYKGERVMKSSVMHSSVQINDKNIDDIEYLEPYTLYINPYYVVTELQGGDKVSKHYYMNTQRVATDISINYQAQESMAGPQQPNARDPKKPSEDTASVNYNAAFADLQATLTALGHQKLDVNGLGTQPTLEEYYPELVREKALNATAAKNAPESTTRVLFWYHPDYLGNVDLVTERDGKTYEFFTYNPWGEEMHQYNANTFGFSSPYRFNAKEKDQETGLHYYGARYYQSKLSMWLSVDPLASKGPNITPYSFSHNNPVMMVDPDGNWPDWFDNAISSVGNTFSSAWNSMTSVFQKKDPALNGGMLQEVTVSASSSGTYGSPMNGAVSGNSYSVSGAKAGAYAHGDYAGGQIHGSVFMSEGHATQEGLAVDLGVKLAGVDVNASGRVGSVNNNVFIEGNGNAMKTEADLTAGVYYGQSGKYGVMLGGGAGAYALDGDVGGGVTVFGFKIKGTIGGSVGSAHIGLGLGGLYNSQTGDVNVKGKAHLGLGLGLKLAFEIEERSN